MFRYTVLFFCMFFCTSFFAQEVERIVVKGYVSAEKDAVVEGIHIYNISSQKGTITGKEGAFEIAVAQNDRLEVSAIQFAGFKVVVSAKAIAQKSLIIFLNRAINKLDEVLLKEHDLTGVLKNDVSNIDTYTIDTDFDLSYEGLEDSYEFAPDGQTAIAGNAAEDAQGIGGMKNGLNFISLGALALKAILGPPKKKAPRIAEIATDDLQAMLHKRFDVQTLKDRYAISAENAADFIYFIIESRIPQTYFKPENQLLLFEYVQHQSTLYKEQIKR